MEGSAGADGIGLDRGYLRSLNGGILKICEIVVDLIAFICASVWIHWGPYGGVWTQFVTMSAMITTGLLFCFHLFRIIYKLPGPWGLIQLIYYVVYTLCMLITAIVAASRAHWDSSIGATAFFTFAATALYMIDTFFLFRAWQSGRGGGNSQAQTSTTTTTTTEHTSYETKVQY